MATLDMSTVTRLPAGTFEFVRQKFDNAKAYDVYGFGGRSGDVGPKSALLGMVACPGWQQADWFATPDTGGARRWWGPFNTRDGAARFLLGARVERYLPALHTDAPGVETTRAAILDRETITRMIDDMTRAVRAFEDKAEGDSNDDEIEAGQDLAGEVEAACAVLGRMIAA